MVLPKWAFKATSRARSDGSIDMVFRLRPLGRLWLYWSAVLSYLSTKQIVISIEIKDGRPVVTHQGERVDPDPDYVLTDQEIEELIKRVPDEKLPLAGQYIHARRELLEYQK